MTLAQLNEFFALWEQLRDAQEMRRSFLDAARPGAQVLTGMPRPTGVRDKVGDLALEIAHLDTRIEELGREIIERSGPVEAFISEIPDDRTKMVFRLRFLHGMTWPEVAEKFGGGNSANGVQKVCYRYLGMRGDLS